MLLKNHETVGLVQTVVEPEVLAEEGFELWGWPVVCDLRRCKPFFLLVTRPCRVCRKRVGQVMKKLMGMYLCVLPSYLFWTPAYSYRFRSTT